MSDYLVVIRESAFVSAVSLQKTKLNSVVVIWGALNPVLSQFDSYVGIERKKSS